MCDYCTANEDLMMCKVPLFGLPSKEECTMELATWICEDTLILQIDCVNSASIDNGDIGKIKIKFCPMCGRKL